MSRLQSAWALSLGLHATLFTGQGLWVFHDPQVRISHGETRVVALFLSPPREALRPEPAPPQPDAVAVDEPPEKAPEKKTEPPLPSPPPEEGVEYEPPGYRRNLPPPYPREAFLKRIQGIVWILAAVNPRGEVTEVEVERSSGAAILDRAAAEAVHRWSFSPARRAGIAVAARVRIPIRFEIISGRPRVLHHKDSKRREC